MKQDFYALVVDDDDLCRRTMARMLRRLGAASVMEAVDGQEALHVSRAGGVQLDLIVCDLKMPRTDGIETLRGLAATNVSALIVLASGADARVLRTARAMAASFGLASLRTIGKPLTMEKFKAILDAVEPACEGRFAPPTAYPSIVYISVEDIRRGLARDEFVPYFQPKVAVRSGRVIGAEALVRWVHPVHGVLSPGKFLAVVQAAGLMDQITDLMLERAAARCAVWCSAGHDLTVSVNLPVTSLIARDVPDRLEAIVAKQKIEPEHITLEVTEDAALHEQFIAREVLTRLRLRGFGLSIDDFGTGYSTLQQLLEAPFNELKIDQGFVQSAPHDDESAAAIVSSTALARRLGLTVVAEGVETEAQWRVLEQTGCNVAQGYFIARPMPGEAFEAWVAAWNREIPRRFRRPIVEAH